MTKTSLHTIQKRGHRRKYNNHTKRKPAYAARARRQYRRKRSHFVRNLFVFICIVLIMICIFFVKFWQYLADYQQSLPSMFGEEILKAYQKCDTTLIKKYTDNLPSTLSDDLILHTYLSNNIHTKDLYYYENAIQDEGNRITYTFCNKNQKFADLTVTKTGQTSKYGFPLYEITSLKQYPFIYYTLVQYPGTTILTQNTPVDASYQTDQEILASCFDQIDAGPFYKTTYSIPDFLVSTELAAADSAKNSCDLVWDKDHTTCTSSLLPDDTMKQDISDFSESASKAYAIFATIKYADKSNLLSYLYPNTDFYKAIRTYDNDWGITKTSDRFDAVSSSNFMKYSDTEYSCNISLNYFVSQGTTEKEYPLNITCYVTYKNGKPQVVDLEVN